MSRAKETHRNSLKIENCPSVLSSGSKDKLSARGGSAFGGKILLFCTIFLVFALVGRKVDAATISKPMQSLGLVGYWSFDVGKGGAKAVDMSGRGNNGTLTNMNTTAAWVGGKIGNALEFDGSNDYVITGNVDISEKNNGVTAAAWIYVTLIDGTPTVIAHGGGNWYSYSYWAVNIISSSRLQIQTSWNSGFGGDGSQIASSTTNVIPLNTWVHVVSALWYSSGTNTTYVRGYVNGNVVISQDFSGKYLDNITSRPFIVGGTNWSSYPENPPSYYFSGLIDEVRIYNRVLSAEEIKRLYRQTNPQFNASQANKLRQGLVGMWTFDGVDMGTTSAIDRSGNANTGWLINGAKKAIGKIGQALNFDGVDDYVRAVIGSVPSATFTISAWIKLNELNREQHVAEFNGTQFYVASNNKLGTGDWGNASGSTALTKGQWYQIVITRNSSQLLLFLNGSQDGSGSVLTNEPSSPFFIGDLYGLSGNYQFNGLIDEVRIYNRALTEAEIKQLYKAGSSFHPNVTNKSTIRDGLVGQWSFDGNDMGTTSARDASGNANTGWLINGTKKTIGKIGQALNFNLNHQVNVGSGSSIDNLGPTTISAWIKPNTLGSSDVGGIAIKGDGGASGVFFFTLNTSNSIRFIKDYVTTDLRRVSANNSITLGVWQHVVMTWDGSATAANVHLFVNGVETTYQTTIDGVGGKNSDAALDLIIGGNTSCCVSSAFDGNIDEVRIYNRALTPAEIKRLYNMGR